MEMLVNYKKIPGFSKLFLDYVYNFSEVERFYSIDFRKENFYAPLFKRILNNRKIDSNIIYRVVKEQNENIEQTRLTKRNIELLKENNTIAVVTGQQIGIFTGPLYAIYKTITVLKLSSYLNEKYHDFNFVPVFWMATEDHDFEEINSINIIDKNNILININYDDTLPPEANRGYVGNLKIKKPIQNVFEKLKDSLLPTEFTSDLIENLNKIYSESKTFSQAFKELLNYLFGQYGLVIFDPSGKNVKDLLIPVLKNELINFRSNSDAALLQSAELEEFYHAQVKVRPVNLFYSDGKGRRPIEPTEAGFKLKRGKAELNIEEILRLVEESPEKFSPNVLLRPICQDYLFPTGLYVAGPSEIAYFAQVMPLYKKFNITPPIIFPRASVTIVEKNIARVLTKFNLKPSELFLGEKEFSKKMLEIFAEESADKIFANASENIESVYNELKKKLKEIDKTLEYSVEKALKKALNNLNVLREKTIKAQELKHQAAFRQIKKTQNLVFPAGKLQERKLNIVYFLNKYGLDTISELMNLIAVNKFEHQIITDL